MEPLTIALAGAATAMTAAWLRGRATHREALDEFTRVVAELEGRFVAASNPKPDADRTNTRWRSHFVPLEGFPGLRLELAVSRVGEGAYIIVSDRLSQPKSDLRIAPLLPDGPLAHGDPRVQRFRLSNGTFLLHRDALPAALPTREMLADIRNRTHQQAILVAPPKGRESPWELKSDVALARLSKLVRRQNVFVGPEGLWCLCPGPFDNDFAERLQTALRAVALTSRVFGTMRANGSRMTPLNRETRDYRLNARVESWLTVPVSSKRERRLRNARDPWLRAFGAATTGNLDPTLIAKLLNELSDSGCGPAESAWMLAACVARPLPGRSYDPWSLAAGQLILDERRIAQAAGVLVAAPYLKRFGTNQKRRVSIPLQGKLPDLLNHFVGPDDLWSAWLLHTLGFVGLTLDLVDADKAGGLALADSAPVGGLSRSPRG